MPDRITIANKKLAAGPAATTNARWPTDLVLKATASSSRVIDADTEIRFAGPGDWRVTVFPPYALIVFILMSTGPALLLGWLIAPNVGWLVMCTTTSIYYCNQWFS